MIAKFAATIDEVSGGRLILGLGAGWNQTEYEAFGFPYDHRASRFEEAFTIIRTLIRQGSIDFDGTYYRHRGMELQPPARSDMKILLGSNGPRMLRIGLGHADMWNWWFEWFGNRAAGIGELQQSLEEACSDIGRDASEIERTAAVYVQLESGTGREAGDQNKVMGRTPPISGTGEQIAQELDAFGPAGVDHLQIVLDPITRAGVEELAKILSSNSSQQP